MKKKISMLLCAVLLITSLGAPAALAAFSDVSEENPYQKAIVTLSMLETSKGQKIINGYEDGTFKPDGAITRAECAKIITCVMNADTVTVASGGFTDVDDHWAKDNIGVCASLGIINGMGDGTFKPDDQVTYEQMLKMTVCMLGYTPVAEYKGGYPDGYISEANDLGLLEKISGQGFSEPAARGVVAQIVYNALEVSMAQTYDGITTATGRTLLTDYLKTEKIKGTLVGVEEAVTADCTHSLGYGLMDVRSADGIEHILTFTSFTKDVNEIRRNLGKELTVYSKDSAGSVYKEVIAIDYETAHNKVMELSSFDVDSYDGVQLSYYNENGRRSSQRVDSSSISIRYNGKLIGANDVVTLTDDDGNSQNFTAKDALNEWLNSNSRYFIYGSVRLVDSGDDGVDMIEILDYDTLVAYAKPTASDYRVQDRLETTHYITLDPNSVEYSYTITKDNKTIAVTDIAANDVLLYACSLGSTDKVITVTDTAKPITGTITMVNDTEKTITINGEEHRISDACREYLQSHDGRDVKSGVSGTFYVDALGTIAYATLTAESAMPYAYIVNASMDIETNTAYVTAYMPSNSSSGAKVFPMASRVTINGSSMRSDAAIDALRETQYGSNKDADIASQIYGANKSPEFSDTAQIVRMKLTSDGKVSEIVTLDGSAEGSQNEEIDKLVRYQQLGRYYYTSNSFRESSSASTSLFTTNSSTSVIYVPMTRGDRDKYSNRTPSSAFTSGESYYVEAYNVNSSKVASLVMLYGSDGAMTNVTKNTDFAIVASDPSEEYNDAKNTDVFRVSMYRGAVNTPTEWLTYDNKEFANVRIGDVVQFAYDSDNLAQGLVMNIPYSDISAVLSDTESSEIYDWSAEQVPNESNNYQSYKFDYRFKSLGSDGKPVAGSGGDYTDEPYTSTSIGTVPYLRAYMANVAQVLPEENKLYLTKRGFYKNDAGEWKYDEADYEEVPVSSSVKVIRMQSSHRGFDRYIEGTTTDLKFTDLRDAKNYGISCSKVLVCMLRGAVRLIVVYE